MIPDTAPPSLAALYNTRAWLAYAIEHESHTPAQMQALHTAYAECQAEIATQAAQWPARCHRPPPEMQAMLDDVGRIMAETAARCARLGIAPEGGEETP
jgi:hypothetical protein